MNPRITPQTRADAAQQLRQWATARDIPQLQIEQIVTAILSGQHDATTLQARIPVQAQQQRQQQQHPFVPPMPAFDFHSLFGRFLMPPMPVPPIIPPPLVNSPPATSVPNMFPNAGFIAPNAQATRTTFPGGEAIQHSSSYSGQRGVTSFQYSASSTSMAYEPSPQIPMQAQRFPPLLQQPLLLTMPLPQPAPIYEPLPMQSPPQRRRDLAAIVPPEPEQPADKPDFAAESLPQESIWNPAVPDKSPQNPRIAETFRKQLGEEVEGEFDEEATYFSDIPGMPDRTVQR